MIRAAVIGVGYLGKFHAEKYHRSPGAELVAVVDTDAERASAVATVLNAQAVSDYRELAKLGINCASVATNTSSHHEIASFLLEHGIDVLVEKPFTVTQAEARNLIELATARKRVLQVGHLERFNPAFVAIKALLNKPCFFEVRRIAPFSGRSTDVDVVLDLMIHDIDIVSHLVDKPVNKIEAIGVPVLTGSVDIANARITFEGGAIANVTASRAAYAAERTIRIFQPELYISLDFGRKKYKVYGLTKDQSGRTSIAISEHDVEERDALYDEVNDFIRCVQERAMPAVSGNDGLRALELALMIKRAIRDGASALLSEMELPPSILALDEA